MSQPSESRTTKVTMYVDYVCPYCLLAEAVIARAFASEPVELEWRAFELRPDPIPTLRPEDPYLPTVWRQSVYPMAERLGVPIRLPTLSPQPRTAKAFELLCLAQDRGRATQYSMRVLQAFFQENRDIGDPAVLVDIAAQAGLDPAEAETALVQGAYAERHREALRHAREDMAIGSVPTIVVGDRIIRGVPQPAALRDALEAAEAAA